MIKWSYQLLLQYNFHSHEDAEDLLETESSVELLMK